MSRPLRCREVLRIAASGAALGRPAQSPLVRTEVGRVPARTAAEPSVDSNDRSGDADEDLIGQLAAEVVQRVLLPPEDRRAVVSLSPPYRKAHSRDPFWGCRTAPPGSQILEDRSCTRFGRRRRGPNTGVDGLGAAMANRRGPGPGPSLGRSGRKIGNTCAPCVCPGEEVAPTVTVLAASMNTAKNVMPTRRADEFIGNVFPLPESTHQDGRSWRRETPASNLWPRSQSSRNDSRTRLRSSRVST